MACSKHKAEQSPLQEISFSPSLEEKFCNTPDFLHHLHRPTFCTGVLLGGDVYVTHTPATDWPIYKQNSLSNAMLCLGKPSGLTVPALSLQAVSHGHCSMSSKAMRDQLISPQLVSLIASPSCCSSCLQSVLTLDSVVSGQKDYSTPPGRYTS